MQKLILKRQETKFPRTASSKEIFTRICHINKWGDANTRSGKESSLLNTVQIRRKLPHLIKSFKIESLLDIPCGDFYWMQATDLPLKQYLGADIVDVIIEDNNQNSSDAKHRFIRLNILSGKLPISEGILCRECLVHFHSKI